MTWLTFLACGIFVLAGVGSFWLAAAVKPHPILLSVLGPVAAIIFPPAGAAGLVIGGWLAEAFRPRKVEGTLMPHEKLTWKLLAQDALGVTLGLLTALLVVFRFRDGEISSAVLVLGLFLALTTVICYLYASSWTLPVKLRIKHGYAVGFLSFLPWAYPFIKQGWIFSVLGFLTFIFFPPFILALFGLPAPSSRRRGWRQSVYRLPMVKR